MPINQESKIRILPAELYIDGIWTLVHTKNVDGRKNRPWICKLRVKIFVNNVLFLFLDHR
jgi:hypothetical protein